MTIEAMKQALEAMEYADACLKKQLTTKTKHEYAQDLLMDAGVALHTAIAEAEKQEPVAHSVVAGALFDFMGWLTSRDKRLTLSSTDDASPAVEAITEFAKMRGLSLDDARVQDWQDTTPPAAQRQWVGLTDEEVMSVAYQAGFEIHEDYDTPDADPNELHWWSPDYEQCDDALFKLRDLIEAKLKEKNA